MVRKLNYNTIFIPSTCLISILLACVFEFIINKVFPQPTFFFSFDRFVAIALITGSTICLIRYRKYFCKHLHKAFLLFALAFGISFILVFPRTVYLSPDDQIHFKNAYFFMSDTVELKGGFSAIESAGFTNVGGKGFDELATLYESMNQADETVISGQYQIADSPQLYTRIVYLPFYLGFRLSGLLHLNFTTSVAVAKICNLFCYIALVYFAIKYSGKFNKIFFVIGLLTSNMFLATQFSYDPLVIANLLLAISLFLYIRQTEKPAPKYFLGFVLAATFGSLTKAVYCPILLLALLIPNDKFDCKNRAIAFKVCSILIMLVLASTFVLPILSGGLASDIRGGSTSVSGQINFLLHNPLKAIAVVVMFLTSQWPSLAFYPISLVSLGVGATAAPIYELCSIVVPLVGVLSLLALLWSAITTSSSSAAMTSKTKISLAVIYLILLGATTASMYLSFTSVGNLQVDGMQPRYLMPFFPLFWLLLTPSKSLRKSSNNDSYATLIIPYVCLALIFGAYILRVSML